jgi:hypothetical protein
MTILQDLSLDGTELMAELNRLRLENAALKQAKSNGNGIKVFALGESSKEGIPYKGTLGVKVGKNYNVLYASQWLKLLDMADEIRQTIETNKARLSWKED